MKSSGLKNILDPNNKSNMFVVKEMKKRYSSGNNDFTDNYDKNKKEINEKKKLPAYDKR